MQVPPELIPCFNYYIVYDLQKLPEDVRNVKLQEALELIKNDLETIKGKGCNELGDYFAKLKERLFPGAFKFYFTKDFNMSKNDVDAIVRWLALKIDNVVRIIKRNGYEGFIVRADVPTIVLFKHKRTNLGKFKDFEEIYDAGILCKNGCKIIVVRPKDVEIPGVYDSILELTRTYKLKLGEVPLTRDELAALYATAVGTPMTVSLMNRYTTKAEEVAEKVRKQVYG